MDTSSASPAWGQHLDESEDGETPVRSRKACCAISFGGEGGGDTDPHRYILTLSFHVTVLTSLPLESLGLSVSLGRRAVAPSPEHNWSHPMSVRRVTGPGLSGRQPSAFHWTPFLAHSPFSEIPGVDGSLN